MKADTQKALVFGGIALGALWLLSRGRPQLTPAQLIAAGISPQQIAMAPGYPQIPVSQAVAWGYVNAAPGYRVTKPGDPAGVQYLIVPG